jgi:pimeloyl-ACP methyl ester carboxylesterase
MTTITTTDGTEILSKDWGPKDAQLGVAAFSETDVTEDLKAITVPTLILHGEDDQIVPIAISGDLSAKLVSGAEYKRYPGLPHGMPATHGEQINADPVGIRQGLSEPSRQLSSVSLPV